MAECRRCGHPEVDHGDRAVSVCIELYQPPLTLVDRWIVCHCPGWAP